MAAFFGLATMIACTVLANLFMKQGAMALPPVGFVLGAVHWKTVVGLCFFGCAGVLYAWVLKFLPLNIAQSFASFQFVAVIVAATLVLAEPIPLSRWIGIAFITVGIIIVGLTQNGPPMSETQTATVGRR